MAARIRCGWHKQRRVDVPELESWIEQLKGNDCLCTRCTLRARAAFAGTQLDEPSAFVLSHFDDGPQRPFAQQVFLQNINLEHLKLLMKEFMASGRLLRSRAVALAAAKRSKRRGRNTAFKC